MRKLRMDELRRKTVEEFRLSSKIPVIVFLLGKALKTKGHRKYEGNE